MWASPCKIKLQLLQTYEQWILISVNTRFVIVCYAALLQQKITDTTGDGCCKKIEMDIWDGYSYEKKDGWRMQQKRHMHITETLRTCRSHFSVVILDAEPEGGNASFKRNESIGWHFKWCWKETSLVFFCRPDRFCSQTRVLPGLLRTSLCVGKNE